MKPALFNQTLVTPQKNFYFSARGDLKINKKHTLVGNFEYGQFYQDRQGIGGFSLPSRAYRGERRYHNFQMTETAILNEKTINETRLQLSRSIFRQTAGTALPALNVLESFFGGGSQVGSSSNRQDRLELQNFTSWSTGSPLSQDRRAPQIRASEQYLAGEFRRDLHFRRRYRSCP